MLTVTLKDLRNHGACVFGYNTLVCALQNKKFDAGDGTRTAYIRYAYKEPVTMQFVLKSNGYDDALWALRSCKQSTELDRAMRLYAVWCARHTQYLAGSSSGAALDAAEQYAEDKVPQSVMLAARYKAVAALTKLLTVVNAARLPAPPLFTEYFKNESKAALRMAKVGAMQAAIAATNDRAWQAAWLVSTETVGAFEWALTHVECENRVRNIHQDQPREERGISKNLEEMFIKVFCGEELNTAAMVYE